jgi:hypothetical protein
VFQEPSPQKRDLGYVQGLCGNGTECTSLAENSQPHSAFLHKGTDRLTEILADPVAAIRAVRRQHPLLTSYGVGKVEPFHQGDPEENFRRSRQEMTEPHEIGQFIRAAQYLATRNNRKTVSKGCSSYGWKHRAESWYRRRHDLTAHQQADCYVSNGMFICAALAMGFGMEPIRHSSINVFLTIGAPLVREKRGWR